MYHLITREISCSFLPCVLLQEGGVTQLRFSPAETALAVCSGGGHVSLWELNLADQGMAKVSPHIT